MSLNPAGVQMGQCTITGKMVPEDELVTFQGHRVCAEGKAVLLDRLKAGEAMPGELERPTVLRRFGCIFVDGLIIGIPFAILNAVAKLNLATAATMGAIALVTSAVQLIYFGQLHGTKGQSVGKMAGKLRVVNLDGSPISLGTAYVRSVAYVGPSFLSGIALFANSTRFIIVAQIIVVIWGIAEIICALVDRTAQRALHDRIAGTRVIQLPA